MTDIDDRQPITEVSLRGFFHEAVETAVSHQQIETDEATVWYLGNLLCEFSRAERLFLHDEEGVRLPALAGYYAQAAEAADPRQRRQLLRRLGDVALFISGLFSGLFSRRRRLVDVDYYIAMGGSAYGVLADDALAARGGGLASVFDDLSRQFVRFVDVLGEVGENAFGAGEGGVLREHELWLKTDSPRLARRLQEAGVVPIDGRRRH